MRITIDIKRFSFYVWVGLGYLLLWQIHNLVSYPETFFVRCINETWRAAYIVVVNIIFFEYTLPFIRKKRKSILFNIATEFFLLPAHLFKRIHRSFIVSVSKIESYTADMVEVNGVSIPIGRGYRDVLEQL